MVPLGSASIMEGVLAGKEGEWFLGGAIWDDHAHTSLHRGEVINGGFGLVLDGTQVRGGAQVCMWYGIKCVLSCMRVLFVWLV